MIYAYKNIRISTHSLRVETACYGTNRLERHDRKCRICNTETIVDDYHFVLCCTKYRDIRKKYLPRKYYDRPNILTRAPQSGANARLSDI